MSVRGAMKAILCKPFIVNWSEMSPSFVITARSQAFRTAEELNNFVKNLRYREGFIKVNHVYCRDNAWYGAHYE